MRKFSIFLALILLVSSSITAFAANAKSSIYSVSKVEAVVSEKYSGLISTIELKADKTKALYYEVELLESTGKTELIVDAQTGKILNTFSYKLDNDEKALLNSFGASETVKPAKPINPVQPVTPEQPIYTTQPTNPTTNITSAKAKQIALDRVGSGTVTKCWLDRDDGMLVYEVEIISGVYDYDLEISAKTGEIVSFEKDSIYD